MVGSRANIGNERKKESIMKFSKPWALFSLVFIALSTGCASSSKVLNDPDKLVDDGKRNSVLLSYEIVLDSTEKHPSVKTTSLSLRCTGTSKLTGNPSCFIFEVPFVGKRTVDGFETNSFQTEGVSIYQMKYGDYNFSNSDHDVTIEKWRERECYKTKKGKELCNYVEKTNEAKHHGSIEPGTRFFVAGGAGCYIGHLKLHMKDSEVLDFELVSNIEDMDADMIGKLSPSLQGTVASRVTEVCAG